MGHRGIILLGLGAVLLAGCMTGRPLDSTSWLSPLRPLTGQGGPDVMQMETALLEVPVGDRFANEDFWALADDQVLALDQKAALRENGLRVAQVGGLPPVGLQRLLTSERSNADPRLIETRAGNTTRLSVGPALPVCRFGLRQGDRPVPVQFGQAECALLVGASLARDGRVRLHFTPEVRHGRAVMAPQPAERAAWMLQKQQPTETYPALGWEVTVSPNEYVVVGGRFDRPGTLGHQFFIRPDEAKPCQRLLVLRAARPGAGLSPEAVPLAEDVPAGRVPPLALQAVWPTARGSAP